VAGVSPTIFRFLTSGLYQVLVRFICDLGARGIIQSRSPSLPSQRHNQPNKPKIQAKAQSNQIKQFKSNQTNQMSLGISQIKSNAMYARFAQFDLI
jgi:hypothetical protein